MKVNFENDTPVTIIKISKNGCRPCQVVDCALEEESETLERLNVTVIEKTLEQEPEVIDRYDLMGFPTLIIERNGHEMARLSGMVCSEEILETIMYAKTAK